MNAQQVIEAEIERLGRNQTLRSLQDFLRRVSEGLNDGIIISERQKKYILNEISWYATVAEPRTKNIGMDTRDAYQKWLCCPNTVNSFVTAINSMRAA